ncbi:MAG: hypothetical protein AAGH87_07455 [Pseudomonadota bacterium]
MSFPRRPILTASTLAALLLAAPGCLAARVAGDVVEGAVNVTGDVAEGAVNTAGAVVGAAVPGDGEDDQDEDDR